MIYTTLKLLKKNGACKDRYEHLLRQLGKNKADNEPISFVDLLRMNGLEYTLWAFRATLCWEEDVFTLVRLCAEMALHVLPAFETHYPGDNRPRKAIEMAFAFSEKRCSDTEAALTASEAAYAAAHAAEAAYSASNDAAYARSAYAAAYAAADAADAAAYASDTAYAASAADAAAADAVNAAAYAAAYANFYAAADAEKRWQVEKIIEVLQEQCDDAINSRKVL